MRIDPFTLFAQRLLVYPLYVLSVSVTPKL